MRLRGLVREAPRFVFGFAISQRRRVRLAALGLALQKQRNRFVPIHARPLPRQHAVLLTAFMAGLALERQEKLAAAKSLDRYKAMGREKPNA